MSDEELTFDLESDFAADSDPDEDGEVTDDIKDIDLETPIQTLKETLDKLDPKRGDVFAQEVVSKLITLGRIKEAASFFAKFLRSLPAVPYENLPGDDNLDFLSNLIDEIEQGQLPSHFWLSINLIYRIPLLKRMKAFAECHRQLIYANLKFNESIMSSFPNLKIRWALLNIQLKLQSEGTSFYYDEYYNVIQQAFTSRGIDDSTLCIEAYECLSIYEIKLSNWTKAIHQLYSAISKLSFMGNRSDAVRLMKVLIVCAAIKQPVNVTLEAAECVSLIRTHKAELAAALALLKRPMGPELKSLINELEADPSLQIVLPNALRTYRMFLISKLSPAMVRCDLDVLAKYLAFDNVLDALSIASTWCSLNPDEWALEYESTGISLKRKRDDYVGLYDSGLDDLVYGVICRAAVKEKV